MEGKANYRVERIERLLKELQYEVTRGMMDREIAEALQFSFLVPLSQAIPNGVVMCEFRTRPVPFGSYPLTDGRPRLTVVE